MLSILLGFVVVVIVFGTIIYAFFAAGSTKKSTGRLTAFGEAPAGELDDLDQRHV